MFASCVLPQRVRATAPAWAVSQRTVGHLWTRRALSSSPPFRSPRASCATGGCPGAARTHPPPTAKRNGECPAVDMGDERGTSIGFMISHTPSLSAHLAALGVRLCVFGTELVGGTGIPADVLAGQHSPQRGQRGCDVAGSGADVCPGVVKRGTAGAGSEDRCRQAGEAAAAGTVPPCSRAAHSPSPSKLNPDSPKNVVCLVGKRPQHSQPLQGGWPQRQRALHSAQRRS